MIKIKTPSNVGNVLFDLIKKYNDIFALDSDKLSVNNFYEQKLQLKDNTPVFSKNYRLPETQKQEVNKQVDKLLNDDLIENSVSDYNSPVILVPKKSNNGEKKWRMCIDYRLLNKKLIPDKYPLPRIDDILDELGRAKYFSILDLYSGFHQIPLEKSSRKLTSFSTQRGSFQWKVLPFGLNVAPNSFARMMNIAFSGLEPQQAFLYMDDIIVIGCSLKHHRNNLESIFNICRRYNLKLNPYKCEFYRNEVLFLGHKCTDKGILPNEEKIEALKKYPIPLNKDEVRSFVAMVNYYRRFIKNFAELARPLNQLTRKNSIFIWSKQCQNSFELLKSALLEKPILQYPDFEKDFIVTVDASNYACGAVLSQNHDGDLLPISYISRSFQKVELNKAIIEKELLAIHFAITYFRPYLYGRHFTVQSDHRPLIFLYNMKNPASKLTRIRLDLEEYSFDIEHIKGKDNVAADALSRISIKDLTNIYENNVTILRVQTRSNTRDLQNINQDDTSAQNRTNEIIKPRFIESLTASKIPTIPRLRTQGKTICAYMKKRIIFKINPETSNTNNNNAQLERENTLEYILYSLETLTKKFNIETIQWPLNDDIFTKYSIEEIKEASIKILNKLQIILIRPPEVVGNEEMKQKLLKENHDDPMTGGHCGQKKLLKKLQSRNFWRNMPKDVVKFIKNCPSCLKNKIKYSSKEPMLITKTPQKPFDIVVIDTIGPLPVTSNGYRYILTIICDLTKYLVLIPLVDKTAKSVAIAIFENCILVYGTMKEIITDMGTEYKNELMKNICKLLKIEHKTSTAYRHQTVGTAERNHRTLNEYIRIYISEQLDKWEEYIRYFNFCYNITPNSSLDEKYSPFQLVFGRLPNINKDLLDSTGTVSPIYNIDSYDQELRYRLQKAHSDAAKLIEKAKLRNKNQYDKNKVAKKILVNDEVLLYNLPYNKFKPTYSGPYTVIEVVEPNIKIKDNQNQTQTVHKDRVVVCRKH